MAKIYETMKDVERDSLKEKAREAQHAAQHNLDSAIVGGLVATGSATTRSLDLLEVSAGKYKSSSFFSGLNKFVMWAGLVTGVLGLVQWWNKRNEAVSSEAKLSALGPEEVRYPAAMFEAGTMMEGKYCDRLKQEVASSCIKSL